MINGGSHNTQSRRASQRNAVEIGSCGDASNNLYTSLSEEGREPPLRYRFASILKFSEPAFCSCREDQFRLTEIKLFHSLSRYFPGGELSTFRRHEHLWTAEILLICTEKRDFQEIVQQLVSSLHHV